MCLVAHHQGDGSLRQMMQSPHPLVRDALLRWIWTVEEENFFVCPFGEKKKNRRSNNNGRLLMVNYRLFLFFSSAAKKPEESSVMGAAKTDGKLATPCFFSFVWMTPLNSFRSQLLQTVYKSLMERLFDDGRCECYVAVVWTNVRGSLE